MGVGYTGIHDVMKAPSSGCYVVRERAGGGGGIKLASELNRDEHNICLSKSLASTERRRFLGINLENSQSIHRVSYNNNNWTRLGALINFPLIFLRNRPSFPPRQTISDLLQCSGWAVESHDVSR